MLKPHETIPLKGIYIAAFPLMKKSRKTLFFTGTSNIVVPGNRQSYPPAFQDKSRLHYYSTFFNSLEINSSFYKTPMPATFEKWSLDVPKDFQFTIKLSKDVTHAKELQESPGSIERFMNAADRLTDKKGCLLIQFPGKITMDYYNEVERILEDVKHHDPQQTWRIAVEFRHATWYVAETFELMDEYAAALVLHDIPKGKNADINTNAPFVYFRFHGPAGDYRGSYDNASLTAYAGQIKQLLKAGKDVFSYFNNTMGNAFENARTLQRLIHSANLEL